MGNRLSNVNNGEAQVEINLVKTVPNREETTIKKEDMPMADAGKDGIKEDGEMPTEEQKALPENRATVSVGKKLTLNLGNYQSVQISVHLSMPCAPTKAGINDMYGKVNKWVDAHIAEERESVRRGQRGASE